MVRVFKAFRCFDLRRVDAFAAKGGRNEKSVGQEELEMEDIHGLGLYRDMRRHGITPEEDGGGERGDDETGDEDEESGEGDTHGDVVGLTGCCTKRGVEWSEHCFW